MRRIVEIIFYVIMLFCNNSFAYFYHMCVMKKVTNKNINEEQVVICFGDYHSKDHHANKVQRLYLESFLKKCSLLSIKLIVEDLGSANNDGKMVCCNFGINSCESALGKLANKARSVGIAVDNVEYRYCRAAGIGPLLNNIELDPYKSRSSAAIMTLSLYNEVIDEIENIKKYNDGKFLNDLYKRIVAATYAALLKMNFKNKETVADYCVRLRLKQYRQELENLCIFDSALIDAKIMHSIAMCSGVSFILVIAGGSHIEQISYVLKRMGYQLVFETPQTTVPLIKKTVNAGTNISLESFPEPIDIAIVEKFINSKF